MVIIKQLKTKSFFTYLFRISVLISSFIAFSVEMPLASTLTYPIVDTNQTKCYDSEKE
ncbi:MAG: hypothetical protein HQK76_05940 [Desulfobacterales bacterium]|nr:hypothetical protein [Desulfobacterales bacterium]